MSKAKFGLVVASSAIMSCFALGAQARGGGGTSGEAGGMSASHMSSQGIANTNGFNSPDEDKGLERAEDRDHRSTRASQSTTHYGERKALGHTK